MNGAAAAANISAVTVDPDKPTLYDGADPDLWDPTQTRTGPLGIVWFPGVSVTLSPAVITLTPPTGAAVTTTATIENQAITFVTTDLQ